MLRAILIFATLLPSIANAKLSKAECSDIDHSEELGLPYDNAGFGWCYAYSAADLLSFKLKQKFSVPAIALSGSILHFGEKTIEDTSGGFVELAVIGAINQGLCRERDFPSSGLRLATLYKQDPDNFTRKVEDACTHRIHPKAIELKVIFGNKRIQRANRIISEGNILAVNIRSQIFDQKDTSLPLLANHVSTVIGRRWNPKQSTCEFKMRNPDGKYCDTYGRKDLKCKNGHVWLNEHDFTRSTLSFSYL